MRDKVSDGWRLRATERRKNRKNKMKRVEKRSEEGREREKYRVRESGRNRWCKERINGYMHEGKRDN